MKHLTPAQAHQRVAKLEARICRLYMAVSAVYDRVPKKWRAGDRFLIKHKFGRKSYWQVESSAWDFSASLKQLIEVVVAFQITLKTGKRRCYPRRMLHVEMMSATRVSEGDE